jgi:ribonuclease P protein component
VIEHKKSEKSGLPKLQKIRTSAQFRNVYESGRKFTDPFFHIFIVPGRDEIVRFGITATRRLGGAVIRNRIKRVLRESMRQLSPVILPGFDVVILARPLMSKMKEPTVRSHLMKIFRQAGVLPESGGLTEV